MTSLWRRWAARLTGTAELPAGFSGELVADERILASAHAEEGPLVATSLGVWVPESGTVRRIGWHLVSKASWDGGVLALIEADEVGEAGDAVLLRDRAALRFALSSPGRFPEVLHERVTGSIRSRHHREVPGGGAWFVQRKVPGRDGVVLQVRPEPGTDEAALREFASEVAAQLREVRRSGVE